MDNDRGYIDSSGHSRRDYLIRFLLNKPLYYDPYGKESKKLSKPNDQSSFINDLIRDAQNLNKKEIKIIADVDEIDQSVQKIKDKGFKVKAISGLETDSETSPETNKELNELKKQSDKGIELRQTKKGPSKHFAIIGPHLLVESPHSITMSGKRSLFGIKFPNYNYYNYFNNQFDECWSRLNREPSGWTSPNSTNSVSELRSDQYTPFVSSMHDRQ